MLSRFGLLLSILLIVSCGYQYPGLMVSPLKFSVGSSHPTTYIDPPPDIDYTDFRPAGGPMEAHAETTNTAEISLGFEVFQELPLKFVVGASGNFVTFGDVGTFQQTLRKTTLYWWNPVVSERLVMEKTPSIGGYFGTMILGPTIQYGISVCQYSIKEYLYSGVDVYGGKNYSVQKSVTPVASGRSVRHTVEIGYREAVRFGLWFESDGRQHMGGFQLIFSAAVTFFSSPAPLYDCEAMNPDGHWRAPDEKQKYHELCEKN
jgi:hypothetical protein